MFVLKIVCEAIFEPSLLFYDKKNVISNSLWKKEYKDWRTDGLSVFLQNKDLTEYGVVLHNKVIYIKENADDFTEATENLVKFQKMFDLYCDELGIEKVVRLGMRTIVYQDMKLNFSEIVQKITPKIYPELSSKIFKITSDKYEDVAYSSVFKKNGFNMRFQLGPVTKEEMLTRAQQKFPELENLPTDSLFIDLDCFLIDIKTKDVEDYLTKFVDTSLSTLQEMIEYLDEG